MNQIKFITFVAILSSASLSFSQGVAPPLLITEAAEHAQSQLNDLKLEPEYFIRAIGLVGNRYEARFEPPVNLRVRVGDDAPPAVFKIIVVNMDGTTSVEEKEISRRRSIIRK